MFSCNNPTLFKTLYRHREGCCCYMIVEPLPCTEAAILLCSLHITNSNALYFLVITFMLKSLLALHILLFLVLTVSSLALYHITVIVTFSEFVLFSFRCIKVFSATMAPGGSINHVASPQSH